MNRVTTPEHSLYRALAALALWVIPPACAVGSGGGIAVDSGLSSTDVPPQSSDAESLDADVLTSDAPPQSMDAPSLDTFASDGSLLGTAGAPCLPDGGCADGLSCVVSSTEMEGICTEADSGLPPSDAGSPMDVVVAMDAGPCGDAGESCCTGGPACGAGLTCTGGTCACTTTCPAPSTIACGEAPGTACGVACPGIGTLCAGGTVCSGSTCTCPTACPAPSTVACGMSLGSACSVPCPGTGTLCASGGTCTSGACASADPCSLTGRNITFNLPSAECGGCVFAENTGTFTVPAALVESGSVTYSGTALAATCTSSATETITLDAATCTITFTSNYLVSASGRCCLVTSPFVTTLSELGTMRDGNYSADYICSSGAGCAGTLSTCTQTASYQVTP